MSIFDDLIIILPTHKRHVYLPGKIKYYTAFPCQVYICDSTPEEFRPETELPENIHYIWCPDKGFYQKVLSVLSSTEAKLYNLTPDDDFLDLDTIQECYDKMATDSSISLAVGKQVNFNKPYDGKFYYNKNANRMMGLHFGEDKVKNAALIGGHYQNVLWSLYRKNVINAAFTKLVNINPENGNFIELTLAFEACVGGKIFVSKNPLNYREMSKEDHWGKREEIISGKALSSNTRLQSDLCKFLDTYHGEDRKVVNVYMKSYLYTQKRWTPHNIWRAIQRRLFGISVKQLSNSFQYVEKYLV